MNLGHTQANGNVKVTTGNANDFVSMGDVRFSGTTEINTNGGDDRISVLDLQVVALPSSKNLSIRTENGNDRVVMDQLVADSFFADLGNGDDIIHFTESSRTNSTQLDGGAGNDEFTISRDSSIKGLRTSSITRR